MPSNVRFLYRVWTDFVSVFILNVSWLHIRSYQTLRKETLEKTTLKKLPGLKLSTVLDPDSFLSLICSKCKFHFMDFCILWLHYHCFTHSKFWILYVHHPPSVPGKSQDDVRIDPDTHTDLPPVVLVLLPQSLRIQYMKHPHQQLVGAIDPFNVDGLESPCLPPPVAQICHVLSSIAHHIGRKLRLSQPDIILGCFLETHSFITFSYIYYLNASCAFMLWYPSF